MAVTAESRKRAPRRRIGLEVFSIAAIAGGLFVFVGLARYVAAGEVNELDRRILVGLRSIDDPSDPFGPRWLEELVRDFSALGGYGAIIFLTLASAGALAMRGKSRTALTAVGAIAGGMLLVMLLKAGFQRARPDLVPHGSYVYTSSFPSGHSMLSIVTYLTLGAVLARVQPTHLLKVYVIALAVLVALLVGFSRVYLGVHWPSDVLAGWCAGVAWAAIVWWITRVFQRRGTIESEPVEEDAPS